MYFCDYTGTHMCLMYACPPVLAVDGDLLIHLRWHAGTPSVTMLVLTNTSGNRFRRGAEADVIMSVNTATESGSPPDNPLYITGVGKSPFSHWQCQLG